MLVNDIKMTFQSVLKGIKVVEFAGLAPGPMCGKVLADFGASVIKIDQPNAAGLVCLDGMKRSIMLDLKRPNGPEVAMKLCCKSDVVIDPFRPGILEKYGLGSQTLLKKNPKLIYAHLTGFGQTGPLSQAAGHDINYAAISGILSMLGRKNDPPTPPINILADFAGGGILCALGIVLSLFKRTSTGRGQIVDASMSEGAAYVGSWLYGSKNSFLFQNPRGENWLDTGTHFYETYETKDGLFMSVGSIEPQFYKLLLKGLDLEEGEVNQMSNFDENKKMLAARFKEKTQQEWAKIFDGTDACVFPVLSMDEAPKHPHNQERKNFRRDGDHWLPAPSPRLIDPDGLVEDYTTAKFSEYIAGKHSVEILEELGFNPKEIEHILSDKAVQVHSKL